MQTEIKGMRALQTAMETARRKTGITVAQSVALGALQVANSVRSAARPRKKLHRSIRNPEFFRRSTWAAGQPDRMIYPYHIEKLKQDGKAPVFVGSFDTKDPRRVIENRGLARTVWHAIAGKLGASAGVSPGARMQPGMARVRKSYQGSNPFAVLTAKLSYIERAYPGIVARSFDKAGRAMLRFTERKIGAALGAK